MRAYTVIPLIHLGPATATFDLADNFKLGLIPEWVLQDEKMLGRLSVFDRNGIQSTKFALIAEYEAKSIGDPDPLWTGREPRSIQDAKTEAGILANLALWIGQPSPASFTVVCHALDSGSPVIQRTEQHDPLLCHPNDLHANLSYDANVIRALHAALSSVPRNTPIWTTLITTWAGLQTNRPEIRHSLFWIALEALFGPQDGNEITNRISQRIALFLSRDREKARELFNVSKQCYGFRSKIVHGRWKQNQEENQLIGDTEMLVRKSLVRVLSSQELTQTFLSKERENYLDNLLFGLLPIVGDNN